MLVGKTKARPTPDVLAGITGSGDESSLRNYLRTWAGESAPEYVAAFRDLNGDGTPEAIVHLTGSKWCGSGGCNTLVLKRDGGSWKVVSTITVTHTPIRVPSDVANGWHSLGVWVQGGGIQPGYEAELRFNARRIQGTRPFPLLNQHPGIRPGMS